MFILKSNLKRCNPHAHFTDAAGTRYPRMPEEMYVEIQEPDAPEDFSDDLYYRTEQDDAPYVVYTRKSEEQIAAVMMQRAKVARAQAVQSIIVTTKAGNSFDGHEDAQNRMSRAISGLEDDIETVSWVLADNTVMPVNRVELREALRLSGAAQTETWVRPYTESF